MSDFINETLRKVEEAKKQMKEKEKMAELKKQKDKEKAKEKKIKEEQAKIKYCNKQIETLRKKDNNLQLKGKELIDKSSALKRELNSPSTNPTRAKSIQKMLNQNSIRFNQMQSEHNSILNAIKFHENRINEIEKVINAM